MDRIHIREHITSAKNTRNHNILHQKHRILARPSEIDQKIHINLANSYVPILASKNSLVDKGWMRNMILTA